VGFTQSYDISPGAYPRRIDRVYTRLTPDRTQGLLSPQPLALTRPAPDALPASHGGRAAFVMRPDSRRYSGRSTVSTSRLRSSASPGPPVPGSVDYLDSSSTNSSVDWEAPNTLRGLVTSLNQTRRAQSRLHATTGSLSPRGERPTHPYIKTSADRTNTILTVVNLDPHIRKVDGPPWIWRNGLAPEARFTAHDLLTERKYPLAGCSQLCPARSPICPAQC